MKYFIIPIVFSFSLTNYAQNYSANRQLKPLSGSIELPQNKQYSQNTIVTSNNFEETRLTNRQLYNTAKDSAVISFKKKNFKNCIYHYEKSKNIGTDAYFQYIAGLSYFEMWKELGQTKYKKTAKQILKFSENNGYIDAAIFLKKNF